MIHSPLIKFTAWLGLFCICCFDVLLTLFDVPVDHYCKDMVPWLTIADSAMQKLQTGSQIPLMH